MLHDAGYATDIVTDLSLDWLGTLDNDQPFCLLIHHKAPHRPWEPDAAHADMYGDVDIPEPDTLFDDYTTRTDAARAATMRVVDHLSAVDVKAEVPADLMGDDAVVERTGWNYQRYIKDYLRCVASVDDNVGRLLDHLDATGVAEITIVVYTSDQGFFLGDHGWYDKRFIYEQSLRMPMLVRWPATIEPGSTSDAMVTNTDFAQTFLQACGCDAAIGLPQAQGRDLLDVLAGRTPLGLADVDVLPLLGARRPEPPRPCPLRRSDAHAQARLLLQRRARDGRLVGADLPACLGVVRPGRGSGRTEQRRRRPVPR